MRFVPLRLSAALLLTAALPCAGHAQGTPPGTGVGSGQKAASFKIVLVGDSTVATGGGWGPGFCAVLMPNVTCVDVAANGRSSKSFIDEGLWQKALEQKGQYYLIQFGHNDQKDDPARHTDPGTTYAANLNRFVHDVRSLGGTPILLSPLSRRNYKGGKLVIDALQAYAEAARQVATEDRVPFVDLYGLSTRLLEGMTQEEADTLDAQGHPDEKAENGSPTKPDRTHLNEKGKTLFGRMVAEDVVRIEVELRPSIRDTAAAPALPRQVMPTAED